MNNVKNIFGGIIFGLILLIASFCLLWWNEGNNARNIATASYMQKNAVEINSNEIKDENNGKLVALSGPAITDETLKDVNIQLENTLVLERNVQMYQWEEIENNDSNGNTGYEYRKEWSESKIDSREFHNKGYTNPDFPIKSEEFYAKNANIGAFNLTKEQIEMISSEKELTELPECEKYSIQDGKYYSGENIQEPKVGDILISYSYAPSGTEISFIGKQDSKNIKPFQYKGRNNYVQYNGSFDKDGVIEKYRKNNSVLTIVLRLTGWLLMFIGLNMLISPVVAIFGFIPFLGKVASSVLSFIALLISLALSLTVIAIAWFAYRPFLSAGLIVLAALITVLVKKKIIKQDEKIKNENEV